MSSATIGTYRCRPCPCVGPSDKVASHTIQTQHIPQKTFNDKLLPCKLSPTLSRRTDERRRRFSCVSATKSLRPSARANAHALFLVARAIAANGCAPTTSRPNAAIASVRAKASIAPWPPRVRRSLGGSFERSTPRAPLTRPRPRSFLPVSAHSPLTIRITTSSPRSTPASAPRTSRI